MVTTIFKNAYIFKLMKNHTLISIMALLFFSGCGSSKIKNYLKEGKTLEDSYKTTIPFTYSNDLIVIEVQINNNSYNFILDTGATNIISEELANKLNLNTLGADNVQDIHSNEQSMRFARIENIGIGGISFLNTTTGISDVLNEVYPFRCMKVDGIIGSNLMQHAVWDFNFKNQRITITDKESKLNIPPQYKQSKMYIGVGGIPSVTSYINNRKVFNNTIDLGYNGGIVIPQSVFEEQKKEGEIDEFIKGYGELPTGAFGKTDKNKFYNSKIDKIQFGDFIIKDKIVYSDHSTHNTFGLDFFKDYRVIINWNKKQIKIIESKEIKEDRYNSFGYNLSFENNHIIISSIIEQSSASQYLKIGDQILSINKLDLSSIDEDQWCEIWEDDIFDKSLNLVKISILRDSKEYQYELKRTHLL